MSTSHGAFFRNQLCLRTPVQDVMSQAQQIISFHRDKQSFSIYKTFPEIPLGCKMNKTLQFIYIENFRERGSVLKGSFVFLAGRSKQKFVCFQFTIYHICIVYTRQSVICFFGKMINNISCQELNSIGDNLLRRFRPSLCKLKSA